MKATALAAILAPSAFIISGCLGTPAPSSEGPQCIHAYAFVDAALDLRDGVDNSSGTYAFARAVDEHPDWVTVEEDVGQGMGGGERFVSVARVNPWDWGNPHEAEIQAVFHHNGTNVANITAHFKIPLDSAASPEHSRDMASVFARAQIDWIEERLEATLGGVTEGAYWLDTSRIDPCRPVTAGH